MKDFLSLFNGNEKNNSNAKTTIAPTNNSAMVQEMYEAFTRDVIPADSPIYKYMQLDQEYSSIITNTTERKKAVLKMMGEDVSSLSACFQQIEKNMEQLTVKARDKILAAEGSANTSPALKTIEDNIEQTQKDIKQLEKRLEEQQQQKKDEQKNIEAAQKEVAAQKDAFTVVHKKLYDQIEEYKKQITN